MDTVIPIATYRIQLSRRLTLQNIARLIPYLSELGISHLYSSPLLKARSGSTHGYDVIDPQRLNVELGTRHDFDGLVKALRKHGGGLVLDIVPNHMAASQANPWWRSVLKRGRQSPYARYFDIFWNRIDKTRSRLAIWSSTNGIPYRRFFDIGELVAVRIEDPKVFRAMHRLVLQLVRDKSVAGLRIDHIDGLLKPRKYLLDLNRELKRKKERKPYLVVEKILQRTEKLPRDWDVAGTTGYDFLDIVNGLFVFPNGLQRLEQIYKQQVGNKKTWMRICYERKRQVINDLFFGECDYLVSLFASLFEAPDDESIIRLVLTDYTACLPIYRTYTDREQVSVQDRKFLREAFAAARRELPPIHHGSLKRLHRILLMEGYQQAKPLSQKRWLEFVMRWQQFTGPVMAKGVEDTALYNYNPLLSLNEVGGSGKATTLDEFHDSNRRRNRHWPWSLNATSTHDTKRSEDVRARLNVLSENPDQWDHYLVKWRRMNARYKQSLNGRSVPDANEEIFIYQTLLGSWPLQTTEMNRFQRRIRAYVVKALREAKTHSHWIDPQRQYEKAVLAFVEGVLADSGFLESFHSLQRKINIFGAVNSLAQTLLKLTSPGVPDFYQGNELWDFSLVDPDNRRPVDFKKRIHLLAQLKKKEAANRKELLEDLIGHWTDGRIKLYVTYKALDVRRRYAALFNEGRYRSIPVVGKNGEHVIAYIRQWRRQKVLVVVPRWSALLSLQLTDPLDSKRWGRTRLQMRLRSTDRWLNIYTGEFVVHTDLSGLLKRFPVALCVTQ